MAKTIRGELVDFFKKLGGKESDLKGTETTAEMIDAIEQIYHDSGDTLPEVTEDDNGKVLSVVNGEWGKANAPVPPSNDFVVNYSATEDEQTHEVIITANKTYDEISAAYNAGKNIKATVDGDILITVEVGGPFRYFSLGISGNELSVLQIEHNTNNTISISEFSATQL